MWAMVIKEVRQWRRDRRTLAMMIVMPIMLLVVFGYAASFDVSTIRVAFPDGVPDTANLPDVLEPVETSRSHPVDILRQGDADVVVCGAEPGLVASIDGAQLFTARAALQVFTSAAAQGVPIT